MMLKSKSLEFLGYPNYTIFSNGDLYNNKGHKLKPFVMRKGYHKVILQHNKVKRVYMIHQLVALAFIDNPNGYTTVDHIDNDTGNNHVENLQWLPKKVNSKKSWDAGNHNHQKVAVIKHKDGVEFGRFESIAEAARSVKIAEQCISRACKNGTISRGFYWKYA